MAYPQEQEIQQRAYEIWMAAGCPQGQDQEHWYRALEELGDPDRPGTPGSASGGMEGEPGERFSGGPLEGSDGFSGKRNRIAPNITDN